MVWLRDAAYAPLIGILAIGALMLTGGLLAPLEIASVVRGAIAGIGAIILVLSVVALISHYKLVGNFKRQRAMAIDRLVIQLKEGDNFRHHLIQTYGMRDLPVSADDRQYTSDWANDIAATFNEIGEHTKAAAMVSSSALPMGATDILEANIMIGRLEKLERFLHELNTSA